MKENTVHYAKGRARKKEGGHIYALIQFREGFVKKLAQSSESYASVGISIIQSSY